MIVELHCENYHNYHIITIKFFSDAICCNNHLTYCTDGIVDAKEMMEHFQARESVQL